MRSQKTKGGGGGHHDATHHNTLQHSTARCNWIDLESPAKEMAAIYCTWTHLDGHSIFDIQSLMQTRGLLRHLMRRAPSQMKERDESMYD